MTDTSLRLFTTAANVDRAGGEFWANPSNALNEAATYATSLLNVFGDPTDELSLYGPIAASEIPAGATITNIEVVIRGKCTDNSGTGAQQARVRIQATTTLANQPFNLTTTDAEYTLSGPPSSFWSMSGQEVPDFLNGVHPLLIYLEPVPNPTVPETVSIQWAKVSFTHDGAAPSVFPGAMF